MKKALGGIIFLFICTAFAQQTAAQDTSRHKRATIETEDSDEPDDVETPKKQKTKSKVNHAAVGFEAGLSDAFLIEDGKFNSAILGWRIGTFVYVPRAGAFCIQPGFYYTAGGGAVMDGSALLYSYNVRSLEMPVSLGFHYGHRKTKSKSFIGLGPFIAFNFDGTLKTSSRTRDLNFGESRDNDIRRLDYGAGLNTSIEWGCGLFLRGRVQAGLAELSPDTRSQTMRSLSFGFQLGYLIGNRTKHRQPAKDDNYLERKM